MHSSRLPAKVLIKIEGKPMLWHIAERLKRAKPAVNSIIIATTIHEDDNRIIEFAKEENISFFRGSEKNVLQRYIGAAQRYGVETIVRVTADNPLLDYEGIEFMINCLKEENLDYVYTKGLPIGVSTECVKLEALKRSLVLILDRKKEVSHYQEHVTPFILERPKIFKIKYLNPKKKMEKPSYRLTVDTEEDLRLIRKIYSRLYQVGGVIKLNDVIDLLNNNPGIVAINRSIIQKEKIV